MTLLQILYRNNALKPNYLFIRISDNQDFSVPKQITCSRINCNQTWKIIITAGNHILFVLFCSCIQLHVLLSNKDLSIFMFVMIKLRRRFKFRRVELRVYKSVRVMIADGVRTWYCWGVVRLLRVTHAEWKQARRRCKIPVNGVWWTEFKCFLFKISPVLLVNLRLFDPFVFCSSILELFQVFIFYSHFQLSAATYPNLYLGLGQLQVLGKFKTPASRNVLISIELHFKLQSLVAAERRPLSPLPPFLPASPCDCRIKIVYDLIWLCRAVSSFEGSFEWKILSQLSNYEVNDLRRILKFNSPHLKESVHIY